MGIHSTKQLQYTRMMGRGGDQFASHNFNISIKIFFKWLTDFRETFVKRLSIDHIKIRNSAVSMSIANEQLIKRFLCIRF